MANFNPDNLVAQAAILLADGRTADAGAKLAEARAWVRARRVWGALLDGAGIGRSRPQRARKGVK